MSSKFKVGDIVKFTHWVPEAFVIVGFITSADNFGFFKIRAFNDPSILKGDYTVTGGRLNYLTKLEKALYDTHYKISE